MNKQEAISKTSVLEQSVKYYHEQLIDCGNQILECKAIIDAPEPKTGRVMSVDDLEVGSRYYTVTGIKRMGVSYCEEDRDFNCIAWGLAFHDKSSCEQYIEQLKREQELRVKHNKDNK